MRLFYSPGDDEELCYFTFKTVNFTSLEEDKSMTVVNVVFRDAHTFILAIFISTCILYMGMCVHAYVYVYMCMGIQCVYVYVHTCM